MKKDWMISETEIYKAQDYGQIEILMAGLDKSYVITGCAGSGKSVLALIKARQIQKECGDNYQIIVYTTSLCRYMESGRKDLGLSNNFFYHKEWKFERIPKEYADGHVYLVYVREMKGNCIPKKSLPVADYTIVDEIQDFTMAEIQEFINATRKHFLFFGDPAQSVYGKYKFTMPVQNICQVFGANEKIKKIPLYNNYRLPLPVARLVQYIGVNLPPFDEDTYKSLEKELPYVLRYDSLETQVRAIYRLIRMDLTDVAILLPENDLVKQVVSIFAKLNYSVEFKYKEGKKTHDTLNFSTTTPKVMTYHSAKGLQFENVFIPVLEYFQDDGADRRTALYVAMTRTYKRLYVMYSGRLLPEFWQRLNIPSNLYKESEYEEVLDF